MSSSCWHIHLRGQVQGVGFRPFVWRLAQQWGLSGSVLNAADGVHIYLSTTRNQAYAFYEAVLDQAPSLARITHQQFAPSDRILGSGFHIERSSSDQAPELLITPDVGLCPICREELHQPDNRRYQYAFTTCTNCGPRYSIIQQLPYDREGTSMAPFKQCTACQSEYDQPADRRYYSQTNSCAACGIKLAYYQQENTLISQDYSTILATLIDHWKAGKIVAIKGLGGYLLTAAADQETTIQTLRTRKQRPAKPFAIMAPHLDWVMDHCRVNPQEKAALLSPAAPLVLLDRQKNKPGTLAWSAIAPGLQKLGVMLPYTPLFELLLAQYRQPIIATSGNLSQASIEFTEPTVFRRLQGIADYFLVHDRPIITPLDDSVLRISPQTQKNILLRRARGYAPTFLPPALPWSDQSVLALGAELKSSFCLLHQHRVYPSQYFGNLQHFASQGSFQQTLKHLKLLLGFQEKVLLSDLHPNYQTSIWGAEWGREQQIPWVQVQHHKAHFAALLGEHQLTQSPDPILGVIWDGTGWGEDGQIWGGEFFQLVRGKMDRLTHLGYFPVLAGDRMAREPRLSALAILADQPAAIRFLAPKFTAQEWTIYNQLSTAKKPLLTSSMGRLFDAVAALLGLCDQQSFEGQAAMQLEELAQSYLDASPDRSAFIDYWPELDTNALCPKKMLHPLVQDLIQGVTTAAIAAQFHYSLVCLIQRIAQIGGFRKIALSGGVFQNGLLVDWCHQELQPAFEVYVHEQLSPNDENIAFGQLVYHQLLNPDPSIINQQNKRHVLSNSR